MGNRFYQCLDKSAFASGAYKLVPVREEDRFKILRWRNEQIDILRQKEFLNEEKQNWYFENVIKNLFEIAYPEQLLFSLLENDSLIGYGGLVHIDWESRNAEISFLIETERNASQKIFESDFRSFLEMIVQIAFNALKFTKIHTTVFGIDQRIAYRKIIEAYGFEEEGRLRDHIFINGGLRDVFIYSLFNFQG
jgi:RimJ/RimL family protein N-acetyltransferase